MQIVKKIMNIFSKKERHDKNSPEKYNWPIYVEREKYNITINQKSVATLPFFFY